MILIFGGAYQGKLGYAKKEYGGEVFECENSDIDFSAQIIHHLEKFILSCVHEGLDPKKILEKNADKLTDKIIISDDISSGVVPAQPELREWREQTGKVLVWLSEMSDEVIRIFCGLPQKIK